MKTMHMMIFGLDENVKLLVEAFKNKSKRITWTMITNESLDDSQKQFAKKHDIHVKFDIHASEQIDVVFLTDRNESALLDGVLKSREPLTIIPREIYLLLIHYLKKTKQSRDIPLEMNELILETAHDGMIIVNAYGHIQFVNKRAKEIADIRKSDIIGKHIHTIIPHSRLPHVMKTGKKEVNQQLKLENDRKVITTRIPMYNEQQEMIGAFAVFKDITEVVHLAEENTDLKHIQMMLEAIIFSSLDAISVVDEHGKGLMINPAYTEITGLTKDEVIGKPATTDIYKGSSVHDYVLKTGEKVQHATMKVGVDKKDVIVNAAPIIVDQKTVGSVAVIHDLSELHQLTNELHKARKEIRSLEAKSTFNDIIGDSIEITVAREQAKIGSRTPAAVLLRGEPGSGKELFAHAIHNESERSTKPFIRVNCASIAPNNIEKELFGYEDTSLPDVKIGYMEQANKGSIFLDEISTLPLDAQVRLLRVLREKELVRVGGLEPIPLDVRVIVATNQHLEKEIASGTFREDLYYYLNRLPIFIPSLRERVSDIPAIAHHLIEKINIDYSRNVKGITDEAIQFLKQLSWNGNIRELENRLGRAMIYMKDDERMIEEHHIKEGWMPHVTYHEHHSRRESQDLLKDAMDDFEKEFISQIYRENDFIKTKTAQVLGISLRSLYNKLDKYGFS